MKEGFNCGYCDEKHKGPKLIGRSNVLMNIFCSTSLRTALDIVYLLKEKKTIKNHEKALDLLSVSKITIKSADF